TASSRSASRVTDSVSANAARSASVKYGVSRHAATAKMRLSLSPASFSSRECMSTHTLQPLIWLARRWTSLCGTSGTSLFWVDLLSAFSACMAAGRTKTGFFILACMAYLHSGVAWNRNADHPGSEPDDNVPGRISCHIDRVALVIGMTDRNQGM